MKDRDKFPVARYANPHKRGEFTPEERAFQLQLLREAREGADPRYVADACGFWLERQAARELRCYAG